MWDTAANDYVVWGYDWAAQQVDQDQHGARDPHPVDMDTLWDGTHLYVMSAPKSAVW